MEFDNSFWATVALIIFIALIIYLKVPGMISKILDGRIAQIEKELDDAKKLREDAQALLAEYERKRIAAENEAEEIITAAKDEAERMAVDAKKSIDELIIRRTKTVEEKIAQAEAQALGEVRSRSADVAVEAARTLLQDQMTDKGDEMIEAAIDEVGSRLN